MPQKILMSVENPDGHKLEELLETLIHEVKRKSLKICNNKDAISRRVFLNNEVIVEVLEIAKKTQLGTLELLSTISKDPGPTGTPRI